MTSVCLETNGNLSRTKKDGFSVCSEPRWVDEVRCCRVDETERHAVGGEIQGEERYERDEY
jgi:hypothetical protein